MCVEPASWWIQRQPSAVLRRLVVKGHCSPFFVIPVHRLRGRDFLLGLLTAVVAPWQIPPPCSRQALSRSTEGCGKRPVAQRVSSSGGRPTGGVYSGDGASFGHRLGHDNEARYMGPQWLEMTHLKGHSMEGLP